MSRRILVGSMLVLFLLLIMPSIPALQQKVVKEEMRAELREKIESINSDDFQDIVGLENVKHPLLYLLVNSIPLFRVFRGIMLFMLSVEAEYDGWLGYNIDVKHPFLFLRSAWLVGTSSFWYGLWIIIDGLLGWNWYFDTN